MKQHVFGLTPKTIQAIQFLATDKDWHRNSHHGDVTHIVISDASRHDAPNGVGLLRIGNTAGMAALVIMPAEGKVRLHLKARTRVAPHMGLHELEAARMGVRKEDHSSTVVFCDNRDASDALYEDGVTCINPNRLPDTLPECIAHLHKLMHRASNQVRENVALSPPAIETTAEIPLETLQQASDIYGHRIVFAYSNAGGIKR